MIHCRACGYPNDPSEHRCEKCGIRFAGRGPVAVQSAVLALEPETEWPPTPIPHPPTPAPWRGELNERLANFRARRGLQVALPFSETSSKVIAFPASPAAAPERRTARPKPARTMVRAGGASQPALCFPAPPPLAEPTLDFPVAPLSARAVAGGADLALILIGYGVLFLAYHLLGGSLTLTGQSWRWTLMAAVVPLVVLPVFYLFLFLVFTACTPGMRLAGLRLVDFDGRPASPDRRVARVLASIASGGSFCLGFLWAVVDEEHLTWHDRMSETCLTTARLGPGPNPY